MTERNDFRYIRTNADQILNSFERQLTQFESELRENISIFQSINASNNERRI